MIRSYGFLLPTKKKRITFVSLFAVLVFFMMGLDIAVAAEPAGFNLIGTIVSKEFTGAVIKDGTGMQSFFRLYDALPDGSKIVRVEDDSISLRGTDGSLYDMFISHEKIAGAYAPPQASADASSNISPMTAPEVAAEQANAIRQRRLNRRHRFSSDEEE